MTDKTLRHLVAAAIILLLVYQIGTLISHLFGMVWGLLSAVVVGGVSFYATRLAKAGGKSSAWFLLPTLLFTLMPIVIKVWQAITADTNWVYRLFDLVPFLVGFALPVLLLLLVFLALRKRPDIG